MHGSEGYGPYRCVKEIFPGKLPGSIETLSGGGERKIKGQAELAGLGGTVGSKAVALTEPVTARLQIAPNEDGVKFDRLDLSSSFAKINCSGREIAV